MKIMDRLLLSLLSPPRRFKKHFQLSTPDLFLLIESHKKALWASWGTEGELNLLMGARKESAKKMQIKLLMNSCV
jgi:hypothetical protein